MLHVTDVMLPRDAVCNQLVSNLIATDFLYYDKDGFELNKAEQKYYEAMGYPVDTTILNHCCWQQNWIVSDTELIDHSIVLCRCHYTGDARNQLKQLIKIYPFADYLLQTKAQWGLDFSLDAVRDQTTFEVIHCEIDNRDYDQFCEEKSILERTLVNMDWGDAATRVWNNKSEWIHLKGFDQNHWKAKYLLGWNKAERIEKSHVIEFF